MSAVHGVGVLAYVGLEIGKWRRQRGLTQDQLAKAAGLSLATMQRIEKSGPVKMPDLFAIAEALGVDFRVLLDGAARTADAAAASDDNPQRGDSDVVPSDQTEAG